MPRSVAINKFIAPLKFEDIVWLAQDASFRRYGRLKTAGGTLLLMDAPPEKIDSTPIFVRYSALLRDCGLHAPEVYKQDLAAGLLLLEDLGDTRFTQLLDNEPTPENAQEIYGQLMDVLAVLHTEIRLPPTDIPAYGRDTLRQEVALFADWYAPAAGLKIDQAGWQAYWSLVDNLLSKVDDHPKAMVLRDCHLDNFMLCADGQGLERIGVIDFQDGGWGSALYDVTSLLFDARRDIDQELRDRLLARHAAFLGMAIEDYFPLAYGLVLQRALKVLGIFVRLAARDYKILYLKHLYRCWGYVDQACDYLPDWRAWVEHYCPMAQRGLEGFTVDRFKSTDTAMLLAAGKGTRMGALGAETPKPLLHVNGRAIIDRSRACLGAVGVSRFVVNAHHLSAQLEEHYTDIPEVQVVRESALLETGGGVRHALPTIEREHFWVVNGDSLWRMTAEELQKIPQLFFDKINKNQLINEYIGLGSAVLMLVPMKRWFGSDAKQDFCFLDDNHTIVRIKDHPDRQGYGYAGVMYLHRAAIADLPIERFSMNRVFDHLIAQGRLWGHVIAGNYFHVGTPEALALADQEFCQ